MQPSHANGLTAAEAPDRIVPEVSSFPRAAKGDGDNSSEKAARSTRRSSRGLVDPRRVGLVGVGGRFARQKEDNGGMTRLCGRSII
ncbi:hypothetical protein GN956_G24765 [Arapaima gigas]